MFPGFIFDSSSLLLSLPHFSCASCACLLVHHFFRPSYCCGQAELEESGDVTKGVRTSELQRGLKRLASDPWLALGLQPPPEPLGSSLQQQQPTEAELNRLKKAWRRLALKYHPDKTQNRTSALFATIQVRALVWPLRLSSPPPPPLLLFSLHHSLYFLRHATSSLFVLPHFRVFFFFCPLALYLNTPTPPPHYNTTGGLHPALRAHRSNRL